MPQQDSTNNDLDTDRSLVQRAVAEDDRAFTLLMRRFKLPLYRFALRQIDDPDDAEDIVQDTFVAAHRNLARYNPKYAVSTWLYRIALNKCRDLGRKRKTRNFLLRMTAKIEDQVTNFQAEGDPETQILAQNELKSLSKKIADLPEALRTPLILCTIEEMSHGEAAQILGISIKAVETRIYRARKTLGKRINETSGTQK